MLAGPATVAPDPGALPCDDVVAVVVAYDPAPSALNELLTALLAQVRAIVLVDNASAGDVAATFPPGAAGGPDPRLYLVRNAQNLGIAAAQNVGIARALALDVCRFVLLSDDDSLPAPGMVARLRAALQTAGLPLVAAAGPITIDLRSGEVAAALVDAGGRRTRRIPPVAPAPALEVGFLIASGTLVPAAVLRGIGGMRGNYFIDHVDTEWCSRARAAGYRLLQVPGAVLYHRLGDHVRRIWFLRTRLVAYHSPLRDYYAFRNTILMQRDVAISLHWRLHQWLRLVLFAAYYLLLGDLRVPRLRHIWLGIRHGLGGVSGRLVAGTATCEPLPATPLDPAVRP